MGCINSKDEAIAAPRAVPVPQANTAALDAVDSGKKGGNAFSDIYKLGATIGSGTFSVVKEAIHKESGQKYAIKCIKREGLTGEDIEALTAEVAILKQMHHPNIMILHDFFTEDDYYYLVTEFMEGGELFDRIVEKSYYTEREARDLVKLLLEAINYCHKHDVVHRDLKPENLLLTSKDDDASIKIADFGFAKKVEFDSEGLSTACGTPGYVAPEILQGKNYGQSVDIWSIGVITYILLCGYPPFHDDNHNALFRKIKKGKYQFDSPYWDAVSDEAKDLIGKMLVVDPENRATAEQLLKHQWVAGKEVATVQLTSALEELRRYNMNRKFKAGVKAVMVSNMLNKALGKTSSMSDATPIDDAAAAKAPVDPSSVIASVPTGAATAIATSGVAAAAAAKATEVVEEVKEATGPIGVSDAKDIAAGDMTKVNTAVDAAKSAVTSAVGGMKGDLQGMVTQTTENAEAAVDDAKESSEDVAAEALAKTEDLEEIAAETTKAASETVDNVEVKASEAVESKADEVAEAAEEAEEEAAEAVEETVAETTEEASKAVEEVEEEATEVIESKTEDVAEATSDVKETVAPESGEKQWVKVDPEDVVAAEDAEKEAVESATEVADEVAGKTADASATVSEVTKDLPEVPSAEVSVPAPATVTGTTETDTSAPASSPGNDTTDDA